MTALICGISSTSLTQQEITMLRHPLVCGVILFKRNFKEFYQLQALVCEIKALYGNDFLITVDQEGGRVRRFDLPFTQLPPLGVLGEANNDNKSSAHNYTRTHAKLMASELLSIGVDMSFAPVLDIDNGSDVIGDRAFSSDPEVVSELGEIYCSAMQEAGMKTTAKHFPGHGTVKADSHFELPIDKRDFSSIEKSDLKPFLHLIAKKKIDAIMLSHVIYESSCKLPAGYSAFWCQQYLRQKLGYQGVLISDDLGMKAADVVGDVKARYEACVNAGIDIALSCTAELSQELLQSLNSNTLRRRFPQLQGHSKLSTQRPFWQNSQWQSLRKTLDTFETE